MTTARPVQRTVRSGLTKVATRLGVLIALVALWQLGTIAAPSPFFPTPIAIVEHARKMFFSGEPSTALLTPAITVDTAHTLERLLVGFALGTFAGVFFGVLVGLSTIARQVTEPVVEFLRSIPATATLPLFIILFGGGTGMRIVFIAYGVAWFVLINTASGVSSVHPTMLDLGRAFRLPRWKVIVRIVLPAAMPRIFAGLRIGLTAALLLAVVSEFMLATDGVGFQLIQAQVVFSLLNMWAWMLLLAVLGFVLNTVLEAIEGRVLRWNQIAQATA